MSGDAPLLPVVKCSLWSVPPSAFHSTRSRLVELMPEHWSGTQGAHALRRSANVVTATIPTNISNQVCGSGTIITLKSM